jgi:dTDP-4-amino-4,6-dideoxygalactose transaminase
MSFAADWVALRVNVPSNNSALNSTWVVSKKHCSNSWEGIRVNRIAFNKPSLTGDELISIAEALDTNQLGGGGHFSQKCQRLLEEQLQVPKVLLTTSCTDALEMCAHLLEVGPGDEIIVPSFTFVSTASAFALRGARPVFVDVRADTLNLDENELEARITPNTRAIVVVHYAGVGCEMDPIMQIAARHKVPLIEDNAHGLFGRYKGKWLGSFGQLATQSFHESKNVTCGEGGALVLNAPEYFERADLIREMGTNRSQMLRGLVDQYTWVDLGSSHLPSDLLAAFLHAQLQVRQRVQAKRKQIWDRYHAELRDWAQANDVQLPGVPPHCEPAYHLFYLVLPSREARQALIAHLNAQGIASAFHYLPLHLSPMGMKFGGRPGDLPVTESISERLLRLPFFTSLSQQEQSRVLAAVNEFDVSAYDRIRCETGNGRRAA